MRDDGAGVVLGSVELDVVEDDAAFEADRVGNNDIVAEYGIDDLSFGVDSAVFSGEIGGFVFLEYVGGGQDEVIDDGEVNVPFDDGGDADGVFVVDEDLYGVGEFVFVAHGGSWGVLNGIEYGEIEKVESASF